MNKIFISEDIGIENDILSFNPNKKGIISSKLGKNDFKPYVRTIKGFPIYSVYKKEVKKNTKELLKTLSSLKNEKQKNPDVYNKILKRAALFTYRTLKNNKIDTICSIESSSELTIDFINKLREYFPDKNIIPTLKNVISKNKNIEEIDFEESDYLSDEIKKSLQIQLNNAKNKGYFEMKKIIPQYRKLITNWLVLEEGYDKNIINKNILLIDDYITSGQSLYSAFILLKNKGAKNVIGFSLIKL